MPNIQNLSEEAILDFLVKTLSWVLSERKLTPLDSDPDVAPLSKEDFSLDKKLGSFSEMDSLNLLTIEIEISSQLNIEVDFEKEWSESNHRDYWQDKTIGDLIKVIQKTQKEIPNAITLIKNGS